MKKQRHSIPLRYGCLYRFMKMENREIQTQIKKAKRTKVLLYMLLAVLLAFVLFVFVL